MEDKAASPEDGSQEKRVSSLACPVSANSELHQPYCNILSKAEKSTVQMAQVQTLEVEEVTKMKVSMTARNPVMAPEHPSLSIL